MHAKFYGPHVSYQSHVRQIKMICISFHYLHIKINMPTLFNEEENGHSYSSNILDHTQSHPLNSSSLVSFSSSPSSSFASTPSSSTISGSYPSTQGSTFAKSREELMADIEKTIEQIIVSISLGEPVQLPIYTRSTSQKYNIIYKQSYKYTKLTTKYCTFLIEQRKS